MKTPQLCIASLSAALALSPTLLAQTSPRAVIIEVKPLEAPELKLQLLRYNQRFVAVDSLAAGITLSYRYEAAEGCIITNPHREARPACYWIQEDGSSKYVHTMQGWHTFRYPDAARTNLCEAELSIRNSDAAPILYLDGQVRAQVSRGMKDSDIISMEETGTATIANKEARYKKFIFRGSPSVKIVMPKSDELDRFFFHDAEGKLMVPNMRMMTGSRDYEYTFSFAEGYPSGMSYRYKDMPMDVPCPLTMSLIGSCEMLEGSASGDFCVQMAECQLNLKPQSLETASGKIRLLVKAPEGVRLSLSEEQELALSTEAGEPLPPLKLLPKHVCYDKNNRQMYILSDLPDLAGHRKLKLSGELKLKAQGYVQHAVKLELKPEGGEQDHAPATVHYKLLPSEGQSPWTSIVLSCKYPPIFFDAEGKRMVSAPHVLSLAQREALGLSADTPAKAYRFRQGLPTHIQLGNESLELTELTLPVNLLLGMGATPEVVKPNPEQTQTIRK